MAAVEVNLPTPPPATAAQPSPLLPDYVTDPNAVLKDVNVRWRYGRPPDYSKTRVVYQQYKKSHHISGSLPDLVENLVKNWEIEASFKTELQDWRTIDHANYSFSINGGPPQSGEHMLRVGTYNAIIAPNEYYSPKNSDFATSHKTFKRMMPTFAWEVVEVYSGPPKVAFRWRHWGVMKNDYVGFNDKGEKITAKAHGGTIVIEGVTVASVDESLRLQKVETWFDPMEMFRQIAPHAIANKQFITPTLSPTPPDSPPTNHVSSIACPVMAYSTSSHPNGQSAVPVGSGCPVMSTSTSALSEADNHEITVDAPKEDTNVDASELAVSSSRTASERTDTIPQRTSDGTDVAPEEPLCQVETAASATLPIVTAAASSPLHEDSIRPFALPRDVPTELPGAYLEESLITTGEEPGVAPAVGRAFIHHERCASTAEETLLTGAETAIPAATEDSVIDVSAVNGDQPCTDDAHKPKATTKTASTTSLPDIKGATIPSPAATIEHPHPTPTNEDAPPQPTIEEQQQQQQEQRQQPNVATTGEPQPCSQPDHATAPEPPAEHNDSPPPSSTAGLPPLVAASDGQMSSLSPPTAAAAASPNSSPSAPRLPGNLHLRSEHNGR